MQISVLNKSYDFDFSELSVILVGLLIIAELSDSEYIVFRNEVELLQSLLFKRIDIKITAQH